MLRKQPNRVELIDKLTLQEEEKAHYENIDVFQENFVVPYPSGRYTHGYPTGGIHCTHDADIVNKTIKFVLGQIGHNLITGHLTSLLTIRTPADSHRPETYL
jgi:hypothetical protein